MTAETFAELLQAKRIGSGKWQARCVSHADRNPSLSIRQGNRGVLLRCWSNGCTPAQIVAAMGLRLSDLFDGPPASPEQIAEAASQREVMAVMERSRVLRDREARHELWRLERLRDSLGRKLARFPDDAELARLFHQVCDEIRTATVKVWPKPDDGPNREPEPCFVPESIAKSLVEISRTFNQKEEATSSKLAA